MNIPGSTAQGSTILRIVASAVCRAATFFGFWIVLTRAAPDDIPAGLLAAVAASWASLRLLPAEPWHLRPVSAVGFVLHFLYQSIRAGTDVALRALDPRLPLTPGFVTYQARLPPGTKRNAFCAITSLMPGTLPCGPADGNTLSIHCLDLTQPVAEQLAAEEALCIQALGEAHRNE